MKRVYQKELTPEEIAALPDEAIDTSDIPELNEEFWKNARAVYVTVREKRMVAVRVFTKRIRKTPRREIEIALRRAQEVS